jgi:RNA-binding protein
MSLTTAQKQQFKAIAHHLKPAVIISENGISAGVISELERALTDHELIKIKIASNDREARALVLEELCLLTRAETVQKIGKMAVIYRQETRPNPKLSNVLRNQASKL